MGAAPERILLRGILGPIGRRLNVSFFGTPSWPGIVRDVIILMALFIVGVFAGNAIEGMRR